MARQLQDAFFRRAKTAGFLARSAYKLLEIQEKFHVIRPEGAVLDLGCSPGAWLQAAAQHTCGKLVGIDLKECSLPPGVSREQVLIMRADATEFTLEQQAQLASGFQTVLSDMCHSTTGTAASDVARSLDLGQAAATLALGPSAIEDADSEAQPQPPRRQQPGGVLLPGGSFVVKLLEGAGTAEFARRLRPHFRRLRHFRPQATRRESREVYLIGQNRCRASQGTRDKPNQPR